MSLQVCISRLPYYFLSISPFLSSIKQFKKFGQDNRFSTVMTVRRSICFLLVIIVNEA